MPASRNSENPRRGKEFQKRAAALLEKHFGFAFELEVPLPVGCPPKDHKFDLANADRSCVGETKCYTWTETGNMPSAKMAILNEAVFFLSHLPANTFRFVAMLKDIGCKSNKTLAEYYCRTYRHLLNGVKIIEIDPVKGVAREVN